MKKRAWVRVSKQPLQHFVGKNDADSLSPFLSSQLSQRVSSFLLGEVVTTYQKDFGSFCKKMLQRIRKILEVNASGCSNGSGTSWKLLQEDVTMCQEHLVS